MPAVKSLTMTYEAPNTFGTFSEGDAVTGTVTLVVRKQITAQALFVKLKGDANVHWSTRHGDRTYTYSSHTRYFKLKQFLLPENSKDTVVPQGEHVYQFRFDIPPGTMPSSFIGNYGKIVYRLEAVLSRSWRMNRTVDQTINFVSKSFPNVHLLMSPQVGSIDKEMGVFSKGHAHMDVTVDKKAYVPGEIIKIVAKINNASSSEMTPKFSLMKDVVYRANGNIKHEGTVIQKVVHNYISKQTQKEVKCEIQIPHNQTPSIQSCDIISVEYHLKAYLDISLAIDPEVKFAVIILPPILAPGPQPGVAAGLYPAGGIGGPSNSDFLPPAVSMGPYPAGGIGGPSNNSIPPPGASMGLCPAGGIGGPGYTNNPPPGASMGPYPAGCIGGPSNTNIPPPAPSVGPYPASPYSGSYGYPGAQGYPGPPPVYPDNPPVYPGPPGVYPAQPAPMSGGYNNPVPPITTPYRSPLPSSVPHPPPSAPTFQPSISAPEIHPSPSCPPSEISPTAPSCSLLPSAPLTNTDFLSQSDDAPPAYSLIFLSSDKKNIDKKQ